MAVGPKPQAGHRSRPHTADVILEAWGPDVGTCCAEAAAALVATYADATHAILGDRCVRHVEPGPPEAMLLELLDELIFLLDTSDAGIPVHAQVASAPDGGLDVLVDLADPASVTPTGAVPKAISRSELRFETGSQGASCSFLVDL